MAKYEEKLTGDFDRLLAFLDEEILARSMTAELNEESDCTMGSVRCALRVYERFTFMASNRLSLTLLLMGEGENLFLSAITAGGSSTMWKISQSTWGEDSFMEDFVAILDSWKEAGQ